MEIGKAEKPKPSIYLSDEEASKFMDYDVDDEFAITAKIRVSSKSKNQSKVDGKIKTHSSINLELSNIKIDKDLESRLEGKEF